MSTPGDDDPPAGSPPPSTPAPEPTVASEPSIIVEPSLESTSQPASIGLPFAHELPPATRDSEPILPPVLGDDALRDAVGAPPPKKKKSKRSELPDDGDIGEDGQPRRNKKVMLVAAASIVVGGGIAALVLLGRVNAERYALACTTTQAVAEQGRSFPPWGTRPLTGAEWRPIALPPNAQCQAKELDSRAALEAAFLDLLLERTNAALTTPSFLEPVPANAPPGTSPLDAIGTQLEQALLLSRAPERGDQRKQVERLLGDVQYWRASLRLRDASAALADASRQFDAAALQRPLHASDAGAWAEFLRRLAEQLHAGPAGAPSVAPTGPAAEPRAPAPQGTALPVEPAPAGDGSAEPASPPDAGVPTGGVLL